MKNSDHIEALLEGENKNNNFRIFFRAVGIAALLVIIFFIYNNFSKVNYGNVYATYMNINDLPTLTTRGTANQVDSIYALIESQFQLEAYSKVNDLIDYHSDAYLTSNLDLVTLYKGVSLLELERYKQAYEAFSSDSIFNQSEYTQLADWYKGLTLLKQNEIEKAKAIFIAIEKDKNHIKHMEAKKIRKKIK